MKAMIFAAGLGTRLRPFTNHHPKALAKVNGISLLERNILYLKQYGFKKFVINIHHFGEQILHFLEEKNNFGIQIEISDESDMLLETGGGLLHARKYLENEKDFLVMNADILTDLNLTHFIQSHRKSEAEVSLAVSDRQSTRKLLFDTKNRLQGWQNETTGEIKGNNKNAIPLAFSGIHCINGSIFEKITRKGKFSIIDEYLDLMNDISIIGYKHHAILLDIGKPEALENAEKIFK